MNFRILAKNRLKCYIWLIVEINFRETKLMKIRRENWRARVGMGTNLF